ncbi:D-alanyl-D-alanine carboxypeptidase [Friedmanniella luteola]|uniref:D-alanyl-D-alanine carboxypeptidase n=1 Tax=Friedmanniella luteola TaxID=546871 RepID=A0A1H1NMI9_9ACTN|nr:M15 family metallopeptidase [Friedmanniella luteola]SDS00137.1 D-alanyl-D-alanine carboxypeptidase [Friedmanniella luteola]
MQLQPSPGRRRVALLATALAGLLVLAPSGAHADTPAPAPAPALTPTASPSPSGTPTSGTPGSGSPTPSASRSTPSTTPGATPSTTPAPPVAASPAPTGAARPAPARPAAAARAAAGDVAVSLRVSPSGSPVAGRFFQDVGRYAFTGTATALPAGSSIAVYQRPASRTTWTRVSSAAVVDGSFSSARPVTSMGSFVFVATTGGAPGSGDEVRSAEVRVQVVDSTVSLGRPPARVDSLKNPTLNGSVVPARQGVDVHLDVKVGSRFRLHTTARTDAAGRFRATFSYGQGKLAGYPVRATTKAPNRDRWEISGSRTVQRVAVLNAVVHKTTAAEVAKTYRKGCPVGRSKLSTITMNYYGRDKVMHRGMLVIRTDLVAEIERSFGKGLSARFPIAKMNNPNVYGGNDPKQMAANNTSGFNCRKVVGNPYAQSPHSYGIAIDVDTVQNPYRDSTGRWWPANGKSYIDRTPLRFGMLGTKSALTRQLRSDGFFWGGLWNPGRDYQHFEYRR